MTWRPSDTSYVKVELAGEEASLTLCMILEVMKNGLLVAVPTTGSEAGSVKFSISRDGEAMETVVAFTKVKPNQPMQAARAEGGAAAKEFPGTGSTDAPFRRAAGRPCGAPEPPPSGVRPPRAAASCAAATSGDGSVNSQVTDLAGPSGIREGKPDRAREH